MTGAASVISAAFAGRLGDFVLDVAFDAPTDGVTALFGPSGCGKTTILRCMAGLQRLAGHLTVDGEIWQDDATGRFLPPHRRPVGYVFQEASLFAHLSVRGNLSYGAKRAGNGSGSAVPFDDIVALLGIAPLLDRAPQSLSGGERQRVAIGRALLSQPRLLLMDEPLAALDRETREEILPYLEALHRSLALPIVYVSHDIAEVERLADTLVLIEAGHVRAAGPLTELEADPDLPLLRAPEASVTIDGAVVEIDETYTLTSLAVPGGTIVVPGMRGTPGERRRLRIRASDVSFALTRPADSTIVNCLPARIVATAPHNERAAQITLVAALGEDGSGARIVARVTRRSRDALGLTPGRQVFAQIKSVALVS